MSNIAVLSLKNVSGYYAAALMQRGHEVVVSGGGAIHAPGLKEYLECDGCLLLGDDAGLVEVAAASMFRQESLASAFSGVLKLTGLIILVGARERCTQRTNSP